MITPQSESKSVHPLARFVTPEAISLLLKIKIEHIKEIRLWPKVILVVAQGLTRFVSYADLPPIVEAEPPKKQDFILWRKRWRKHETKQAPDFWQEFYRRKFQNANSVVELHKWGVLVRAMKNAFCQTTLSFLRNQYLQARRFIQSLITDGYPTATETTAACRNS
ncbi:MULTISPECIES: hypothetical protein [Nostocales]|uniref:Uncharacterized protein n=3 Tax=Nostocales TaxID=1161 RepID=A0A8S9T2A0_9CYAN|nr:hypothetical protein [Tolypothrix bouteillei]KAF3886117.1 hypothetical protein DA73_0400012020 [Tolypothrix bouteillei VB521301]